MNLILLGMPGAGKGTVANWLVEKKNLLHISTGDLLRQEVMLGTDLGQRVQSIMSQGKLVSDEIMISLIQNYIKKNNLSAQGVIFDGFPRTIEQAKSLDEVVTIDKVILLKIDEVTATQRIIGRAQESEEQRSDDNEETIKKRMEIFSQSNQPLIDYYQEKNVFYTVDGGLSIDEVRSSIESVL